MRKTLFIAALVCIGAIQINAQLIDKPAATVTLVQPEYISVRQLQEKVNQYRALRNQGLAELPSDPESVLDVMINEVLIKQAAAESGSRATDAEVDAYIAQVKANAELQSGTSLTDQQFREIVFSQGGLAWDDYRESIRDQRSTISFIRSEKKALFDAIGPPPDEEIEAYYRKHATSFSNPEVVRFNEIYVSTEGLSTSERRKASERANSIVRAYENGEGTFKELVEQYSDDTRSRYTGGDKGFFARNDPRTTTYGESFIDAIFEIDVGEVSGVIESRIGYHIIEITDHRDPKLLQLDDPQFPGNDQTVKALIGAAISDQELQAVFDRAYRELVAELREQADIKIYEENIDF